MGPKKPKPQGKTPGKNSQSELKEKALPKGRNWAPNNDQNPKKTRGDQPKN